VEKQMINWPTGEYREKGWRLVYFDAAIEAVKPKTIVEIGTNKGHTAHKLIRRALQYNDRIHYIGYDLFELANEETNKLERNGKGIGNYVHAAQKIKKIQNSNPGVSFELHRGFTTDTLTSPIIADFVFIDGGHSYDTVKHDYSMVKDSRIIFFDDYNLPGVKQFCDEIGAINLMPYESKRKLAYIYNDIS
jgi:hypothetical protein